MVGVFFYFMYMRSDSHGVRKQSIKRSQDLVYHHLFFKTRLHTPSFDTLVTLMWFLIYNNGSGHFVIFLFFFFKCNFVSYFRVLDKIQVIIPGGFCLKLRIQRHNWCFRYKVNDMVQWNSAGQYIFWIGFIKAWWRFITYLKLNMWFLPLGPV